jgi:hypothetical protein
LNKHEILIYYSNEFLKIYNRLDTINFRYIEYEDAENVKYFVLKNNDEVIGVLKEKIISGYKFAGHVFGNLRTLMYITINSKYQNMGYSKILLKYYFSYLMENNYNKMYLSPYSKMGYAYLRHNFQKLAKEYKIEVIDKDYCYEY